ncbi:MAG: hypothetical protein R6U59_08020 [Eubacteriales bacterium]
MNYKDRVYWNSHSYGNAIKINGIYLFLLVTVICVVTPATNWLIPIAKNKIPKQVMYRY